MPQRSFILAFLLFWAALWALTIWTWHYDAAGRSTGGDWTVFWLHWLIPLFAAVLARERLRNAVIAGVGTALADLGLVVVWDWMLHVLGRVGPRAPEAAAGDGWIHVVEFAVVFSAVGLVMGLTVFAISRLIRRRTAAP